MKIEISQAQLNTLFYYAHVGSASEAKEYKENFPNRKQPFEKINEIEVGLREYGYFRS
ncbi:MAG: hypothetical protein V3V84_07675 [Candidatus Bathyarchaeia archaeon]